MASEPLDPAALERLAALERAADLAEWVTYPNGSEGSPYRWAIAVADAGRPARSYRIGAFDAHGGRERENADLIVALRNAAPALLRLARAGLAAQHADAPICPVCGRPLEWVTTVAAQRVRRCPLGHGRWAVPDGE